MSKIFFIAYNNTGTPGDWQEKGKETGWKRGIYVKYWTQESKINEPNSLKSNSYYFIFIFSLCGNYSKSFGIQRFQTVLFLWY